MLFSFPDYSTPSGQLIGSHLKKQWYCNLQFEGPGPEEEKYINDFVYQALQFTNRLEKAEIISDHLKAGSVVADRYHASGIVYGTIDGIDRDYLIKTQRFLPMPDVNILIDIDVEDSFKRQPENRDRYEANRDFLERVCAKYRQLFIEMCEVDGPEKWHIVDGRPPVIEVAAEIAAIIKRVKAVG